MAKKEDIIIAQAEPEAEKPAQEPAEVPSAGETVLPEDVGRTSPSRDEPDPEEGRTRKKRSRLFKPIIALVAVLFCIYAVADIISQQNEIEQLRQETEAMQTKIEEAKQLNDEYQQLLSEDEAEFMKRVAVEQLGYAYPNERRFYIVNNADD